MLFCQYKNGPECKTGVLTIFVIVHLYDNAIITLFPLVLYYIVQKKSQAMFSKWNWIFGEFYRSNLTDAWILFWHPTMLLLQYWD